MHPLWPHVQTFRPQLWRAVCGYELNPAVREELLQDVLLAIWESLPRLREAEMLLPFVPDTGGGCARTQWLFEALVTLPLNQRQVLMLQLEGYDYQQIADLLGISAENVGVRLHRARERLKALSREEDAP